MWMIRAVFATLNNSPSPYTTFAYLPLVSAVIIGIVELGIWTAFIGNSEFFGQILSRGLENRP